MYIFRYEFLNSYAMKTTRESAKEKSHKQLVHYLQELLEKNYDATKDYKVAVERAENHDLKRFLKKQVVRREHYATEIDKIIHSLNEHPKESGTLSGSLHRTWINLRGSIEKDTDKALLEQCRQGEKNSIEDYEDKLAKYMFPPHIKEILLNQIKEMKVTLETVKSMDDIPKHVV